MREEAGRELMETTATERRLAAILAADVVGYSRLVEKDETGTFAALKALRDKVIDPLLAKHKGRIVKLMGDGLIAEFGSAVDAVRCAAAVQTSCAEVQAEVPPERRLRLRIGVNLGDVLVEGDDLLGDGVNIAARLEQLCDPGGVLISGTAFDQLQGKIDLPLDFAGEQQVKNISRPVRAYRVRLEGSGLPWRLRFRQHRRGALRAAAAVIALTLIGVGVWWMRPVEPASASTSIAVLPFDNLGRDEQTERLADGITEDIITDLSRFRAIEVIARNSVEIYKNKAVDIRQVGRDLDVRFVLEGSIQRQGERFRITAQLIEAESGTHIWSDRWDRPVIDVFAIQTELAEQLTAKLAGNTGIVISAAREAVKRRRPDDLSAYDLYLLGSAALLRETEHDNKEAVALLKRSLEIDPNLARAWTALSLAHLQQTFWGKDTPAVRQLSLDAAQQATQLDPQDAEAHCALAFQLGMTGDLKQSEIEFERALEINPNSADILAYYSGWVGTFGDPEKAVEVAERAIRLNPNAPLWASGMYRSVYFEVRRFDDAWDWHERRPRHKKDLYDYVNEAMILGELGRLEEARVVVAEILELFPDTIGASVEGWTGTPNFADFMRPLYRDAMGKAGFPVCANENVLKQNPNLVRLPECVKAAAN